jgi:integrase
MLKLPELLAMRHAHRRHFYRLTHRTMLGRRSSGKNCRKRCYFNALCLDWYLQVRLGGTAKSWIFRYAFDGRERSMGLGPLHTIGLAEARERARQHRQELLDGIDPLGARDAKRHRQILAKAKDVTFRTCAEAWMAKEEHKWSARYRSHMNNWLGTYIYPHLDNGNLPVQALDGGASNAVQLVMKILEPIWTTKISTSVQVQIIPNGVLQYAAAKQYIENPNAASSKGPISVLLPDHKALRQVQHHDALPFDQIGKFMANLRSRRLEEGSRRHPDQSRNDEGKSVAVDAIEFLVLTAVRKGQVIRAKWEEFDLEKGIWECTAHKTKKKTGLDYIVPLSKKAMAVLKRVRKQHDEEGLQSEYVFLGQNRHGPVSPSTLEQFIGRISRDITLHGFRHDIQRVVHREWTFRRRLRNGIRTCRRKYGAQHLRALWTEDRAPAADDAGLGRLL